MAATESAPVLESEKATAASRLVTSSAWYLVLLTILMTLNMLERSQLSLLAQPIKTELHLTDTQLGLMGGFAFALFFGAMGIPIARISDLSNRTTLVTVCAMLWSAMAMLCGVAQNFVQLLLFRAGLGVGEAGYAPAAYSLISDIYPPQKRPIAVGLFGLGVPLGTMVGSGIGGWVADNVGWRLSFMILGVATIPVALFFRATVREPKRGRFDEGHVEEKAPSLRAVLAKLKNASYVHLVVGQTILNVATSGIMVWLAVFLIRQYHLGLTKLGLIVGLSIGVGQTIGVLGGGAVVRWLSQRDIRWYGRTQVGACLISAPLFIVAFLQSSWMASAPFFIGGFTGLFLGNPATFSAVQNMVGSRMRGTAVAVLMFFPVLIGVGGGPVFVGWLSDVVGAAAFGHPDYVVACAHLGHGAAATGLAARCASASASGVKFGMIACSLFGLWAALHFFLASRTMGRDLIYARTNAVAH